MEPPSVLVLTTSFPAGENTAAGAFVYDQCRYISENGFRVTVLSPHCAKAPLCENMGAILVRRFRYFFPSKLEKLCYGAGIPTNLKKSLLAKLQVPFFLLAFLFASCLYVRKSDIIHCHWSFAGIVGAIIGILFRKHVVLTMHGVEVFVLRDHWLVRGALKGADCVIFNSSYTAARTLEFFSVLSYSIIPPAIDCKLFKYDPDPSIREKFGVKKDSFFVLSVGRLAERKGFKYLIDAIDKIVNTYGRKNVRVLIGGDGPLKNNLERAISEKNLGLYISLVGFVDGKDKPGLFSEADVFVLPAIVDEQGDTEGLGMVLLEAGACKTPVIASNVGGIVDIVKDSENGFLVPEKDPTTLANAILTLMDDSDLCAKMGHKGQIIFNEYFSEDALNHRVIKIYRNLLNGICR